MAADTPTGLQPVQSGTAIPLEGKLEFQVSPYSGAGALAYQRLIVYSDAGGTVVVFDSLWMGLSEPGWADGRLSIDAARIGPTSAGDRWWKWAVKNTVPETSSYSGLLSFTHATAKFTAANWVAAQP